MLFKLGLDFSKAFLVREAVYHINHLLQCTCTSHFNISTHCFGHSDDYDQQPATNWINQNTTSASRLCSTLFNQCSVDSTCIQLLPIFHWFTTKLVKNLLILITMNNINRSSVNSVTLHFPLKQNIPSCLIRLPFQQEYLASENYSGSSQVSSFTFHVFKRAVVPSITVTFFPIRGSCSYGHCSLNTLGEVVSSLGVSLDLHTSIW